jgi:outer membrane protein assembly factor BamA
MTMIAWAALALLGGSRLFLVQGDPQNPLRTEDGLPLKKAADNGPSAYPMPSFSSDKNSGVTYGILGALILSDDTGRPDTLITATVAYNSLTKVNGEVDLNYFPTKVSQFELDGSIAQKVESELKVFYQDYKFLDDYNFRGELHELVSATDRFFGRAENSPKSAESVLTSIQYFTNVAFGPRVTETLTIQGTLRWRSYRVSDSLITNLPQMLDKYPNELGIQGGDVIAGGILGTWDTRDFVSTPTRGTLAQLYAQQAWYIAPGLFAPYYILGAQWSRLIPTDADATFVTAVNAHAQTVTGRRVPFWELSVVGGTTTLRSYNDGRFTDLDLLVFNVEERIRVFKTELFGTSGEVQVAPFLDVGKVLDSLDDLVGSQAFKFWHYSYGIGLRGVVPPSFLGRLDIAYGPEGLGITIGLGYPF